MTRVVRCLLAVVVATTLAVGVTAAAAIAGHRAHGPAALRAPADATTAQKDLLCVADPWLSFCVF